MIRQKSGEWDEALSMLSLSMPQLSDYTEMCM